MLLNDIKKCQIFENDCEFAYSKDSYVLEVLMKNGAIKAFKYESKDLLQEDITRINQNKEILYG